MSDPKWIRKWNSWIAPKPTKPGVWRRKEGGFLIRGRALDPTTGKLREVRQALPGADALEAYQTLQVELQKVRDGLKISRPETPSVQQVTAITAVPPKAEVVLAPSTLPFWSDYAVSLLERKVNEGTILSAKTRVQWISVLKCHLIPAFGHLRVDEMTRRIYFQWRDTVATKIKAGEYSPHTVNDWLAIFAVVTNAAFEEYEIDRASPTRTVVKFDTREHPTYTEEEPNSLTAEETVRFLTKMRELFPQHYAMVALGFATGLRPSSLRAFRRSGKTADLHLEEGLLYVRRSHTVSDEVMGTTKTGVPQHITLPKALVAVLRWHIDTLPEGPMTESELLFPSETGSFRAPSALDKPFAAVSKAIGLRKHITPRAMRRTFQDLARKAKVEDIVTRAVSGHATETMQHHYSTVHQEEIHDGLARIVALAGLTERPANETGAAHGADEADGRGARGPGGMHGGMHRLPRALKRLRPGRRRFANRA
jgi:integrase